MSIENSLERIAAALEAMTSIEIIPEPVVERISEKKRDEIMVNSHIQPHTIVPPVSKMAVEEINKPILFETPILPFRDKTSCSKWLVEKYEQLEQFEKGRGATLQGVIKDLGYTNIADIIEAHYPELYQKVMALFPTA
jgi:hypothetical protein